MQLFQDPCPHRRGSPETDSRHRCDHADEVFPPPTSTQADSGESAGDTIARGWS